MMDGRHAVQSSELLTPFTMLRQTRAADERRVEEAGEEQARMNSLVLLKRR